MASEVLERVYDTLLDRRVQTEIAQILLSTRKAGAQMRAVRPHFGHNILASLAARGLLANLSREDLIVIHEALRDFITDLYLELPEPSSLPGEATDVEVNIDVIRRRLQLPTFVRTLRAHFKERAMEQTIDTLEVDSNSGLLTKAAAEKKIEQLINENPRRKVAVFFVDGDGLKIVNNISRDAGNTCMSAQADRLKAGTRPSDMVVRWGNGDEMAHIALDVSCEEDLIAIGERHLAKMRAEKVVVLDSEGTAIPLDRTISIGCAMGEMQDIFDLIRLADNKALKRAKGGTFEVEGDWSTLQEAPSAYAGKPGRNRLCVYPSGSIHGECGPMNKLNFLQEEVGEGTDE